MSDSGDRREPLAGANWTCRIPVADREATRQLALDLAGQLQAGDLVVLTGGLGAGKTTFTQALGEALDVDGQVSSPTFVLSRIHRSQSSRPDLVHVDAYRTDAQGLESLDLAATLPQAVTVVEWGRGLVEEALVGPEGSWLDMQLIDERAGGASSESPRAGTAVPQIVTDFSESEADLVGSPRNAVLRGYGPRWAQPPVCAPPV